MALGYCMSCDTLRTIRPGPQKWGSRECEWFPVQHTAPPRHRDCGGVIHEIDLPVAPGDSDGPYFELACELCEQVVDAQHVIPGYACDGHKRPIR